MIKNIKITIKKLAKKCWQIITENEQVVDQQWSGVLLLGHVSAVWKEDGLSIPSYYSLPHRGSYMTHGQFNFLCFYLFPIENLVCLVPNELQQKQLDI